MDAAEILSALKARLLASEAVFMTVPRKVLQDAADTIERLQGLNTDLELLAKKRTTLLEQATQERDAALAEVERLRASLEARTDDLQALKIEYAVVLASSRCQLCGEMVEPPRSFCSTCCAR